MECGFEKKKKRKVEKKKE